MTRHRSRILALASFGASAAIAGGAGGQWESGLSFRTEPHRIASGVLLGDRISAFPRQAMDSDEEGEPALTCRFSTLVSIEGANLLRLRVTDFELGSRSQLRILSLRDGGEQRFGQRSLVEWEGWSAIFNGDTLLVEVLVAPEESAWIEIDEVAINDPVGPAFDGGVASLCGADDRVPSTTASIGRLSWPGCGNGTAGCGGCTAWLTSIGSAMAAGHCGSAAGGLIEFNVPMSDAAGNAVAGSPDDQYPVGAAWYTFQDAGPGFDWAIVSVGANSNTGLRAHWVQAYLHLSPLTPPDGSPLRVTGYGVDNVPVGAAPAECCAWSDGDCVRTGCNSSSLTQQTSTGPTSWTSSTTIGFLVDAEPANSGSPIIRISNGYAVAVLTHGGGCPSLPNAGTLLTQSVLNASLNGFLGGAVFVDHENVSDVHVGTALNPARTLPAGVGLAVSGGSVSLAGGSYPAASGNTGVLSKAVVLRAVSGPVVVGN